MGARGPRQDRIPREHPGSAPTTPTRRHPPRLASAPCTRTTGSLAGQARAVDAQFHQHMLPHARSLRLSAVPSSTLHGGADQRAYDRFGANLYAAPVSRSRSNKRVVTSGIAPVSWMGCDARFAPGHVPVAARARAPSSDGRAACPRGSRRCHSRRPSCSAGSSMRKRPWTPVSSIGGRRTHTSAALRAAILTWIVADDGSWYRLRVLLG
jgi:hypothetical protein